jgi:hypothetical protein
VGLCHSQCPRSSTSSANSSTTDYGEELAATLQHRARDNPYFAVFNYGTNDLTVVLARITRGLLHAAALEERLALLTARPQRQSASIKSTLQHKSRERPPVQRVPDAGSLLTSMPSPEQIAAEVRRRPIGAVIVDICRDLAILPSHPLWRDIQNAVSQHGGSYVRLLKHVLIRNIQLAAELVASPEPSSLFLPPAHTRPP